VTDLRLSDVLARRGVLAPAEVVTLVVALALDLADVHAVGRTHGAVCAEAVRFDPDGRPRLGRVGSDPSASPAADVLAVAAIGYLALGDQRPPRLVEGLAAGLADDPDERCDARELAERVLASGPAAPLRLPWPQDQGEVAETERAEPRSRTSRRLAVLLTVVLAVLLAVVLAVVAGMWTASGGSDPPRWNAVLARLDGARLAAVADRAVAELRWVYDTASPPLRRDTDLIRDLTRRGLHVRGRLAMLTSPRQLSRSAGNAVLSVLERPASYVLVDTRGRVVLSVNDNKPRGLVVHLHRTRDGWRIAAVTAVTTVE
jgi:hypothetical protein